MYSKSFE